MIGKIDYNLINEIINDIEAIEPDVKNVMKKKKYQAILII